MPAQNFPYPFDAEKVRELFAAVHWPVVDADAIMAAQRRNLDALIEANKVAAAGYQELYERQIALFETAVAEARETFAGLQGEPLTVDQAGRNLETLRTAFEKATAEVCELAELAQKANTSAFEVIQARAEEAATEFKATMEKAAA
jgi:hypothetical protein